LRRGILRGNGFVPPAVVDIIKAKKLFGCAKAS